MSVKFSLFINNSFGEQAKTKFVNLTNVVLEVAKKLSDEGISFENRMFRHLIVKTAHDFLENEFQNVHFEYFFLRKNDHIYFIVNDVVEHCELETFHGMFLYNVHSNDFLIH